MSQKGQCTWTKEKALAYGRDWYKKNRVNQLARAKKRNATNPEARRASWMRLRYKKYGITAEQHEAMILAQGDFCAICGRPAESSPKKVLCIDHDHATGEVRELLCAYCNQMLGSAFENITTLKNAVAYLVKHK